MFSVRPSDSQGIAAKIVNGERGGAQKAEFIIEQVQSMEKVSDVSKLTWAFTS